MLRAVALQQAVPVRLAALPRGAVRHFASVKTILTDHSNQESHLKKSWPPNVDVEYAWDAPTNEVYRADGRAFTSPFAQARAKLDYRYHANPALARQNLQDAILTQVMPAAPRGQGSHEGGAHERPWIVFTAGAMGVGKSYVLFSLYNLGHFPLDQFTHIVSATCATCVHMHARLIFCT